MSVKLQNTEIAKAYLGNTPVRKIYIGNTQVWPGGTTFTTFFSGTGNLITVNKQIQPLFAILSGDGVLLAPSKESYARALTLSGSGALSALSGPGATAVLSGSGALSATVSQIAILRPALSGNGSLAATILGFNVLAPALTGDGFLSATDKQIYVLLANPTGDGTLDAALSYAYVKALALSGNGSLTAVESQTYALLAALSGNGNFIGALSQKYALNALLAGSGTLNATAGEFVVGATAVNFSGTGSLSATMVKRGTDPFAMFPFTEGGGATTAATIGPWTLTATDPATAWEGQAAKGEFTGVVGSGVATEWSVMFDIMLNDPPSGPTILEVQQPGVQTTAIGFDGPEAHLGFYTPASGWQYSDTSISPGQQYRIACTNAADGTTVIYVDGVEIATFTGLTNSRNFSNPSGIHDPTGFGVSIDVSVDFSGGGTLSAITLKKQPITADLAGSGILTATTMKVAPVTASLTGSGTLSAMAIASIKASLTGSGTLSATSIRQAALSAALSGSGALTATMLKKQPITAALDGSGALTATAIDATPPSGGGVTDDFNRADSTTSLGSNWTNRNSVLGISGNNVYPPTSTGGWCVASHNTPMGSDDMEASITLGTTTGGDYAFVAIGANSSGEMVIVDTTEFDHQFHIYSIADWATGGYVDQANGGGGYGPGDVVTLRRIGNVYTVLLNGVQQVNWVDSGNVVPRDSSHRLVAIGIADLGNGYRLIDAFEAKTLSHLTGVTYSQSSNYGSGYTDPATYAGMNDGASVGKETAAGLGEDPSWVMADAGSVKTINHIVYGYDHDTHVGFGYGYGEVCPIHVSDDGSTWTFISNTPGWIASGSPADGLVTIPINHTARYVRISSATSSFGYICMTEFQLWGTP